MSDKKEVKPVVKQEKQMVHIKGAIATSDGYYKGAIIKVGQKFDFDGLTRLDGSLPFWIEAPEGYEPKKVVIKHNKKAEDESSVDSLV